MCKESIELKVSVNTTTIFISDGFEFDWSGDCLGLSVTDGGIDGLCFILEPILDSGQSISSMNFPIHFQGIAVFFPIKFLSEISSLGMARRELSISLLLLLFNEL